MTVESIHDAAVARDGTGKVLQEQGDRVKPKYSIYSLCVQNLCLQNVYIFYFHAYSFQRLAVKCTMSLGGDVLQPHLDLLSPQGVSDSSGAAQWLTGGGV